MDATRVTSSEFEAAFGALSDKAWHEPVVMSAEEWGRLRRRARGVGLTSELGEEWIEALRAARVPDEFAHLDVDLT